MSPWQMRETAQEKVPFAPCLMIHSPKFIVPNSRLSTATEWKWECLGKCLAFRKLLKNVWKTNWCNESAGGSANYPGYFFLPSCLQHTSFLFRCLFLIARKEEKNCLCGGGQFINLPIEASSFFILYIVCKIPLLLWESKFLHFETSFDRLINSADDVSRIFRSWVIACWQLERAIHLHYAPVCAIGYSFPFTKIIHLNSLIKRPTPPLSCGTTLLKTVGWIHENRSKISG